MVSILYLTVRKHENRNKTELTQSSARASNRVAPRSWDRQIAKQDLEDHFGPISSHGVLLPANGSTQGARYCKAVCVIRFRLVGTWHAVWPPRVPLQTLQRGYNTKSFFFQYCFPSRPLRKHVLSSWSYVILLIISPRSASGTCSLANY